MEAIVRRGGQSQTLSLSLPAGWRQLDDISWRVSSWGLRRMSTGGLKLEELPVEDRRKLNIADGQMALVVRHVGQYGAHAAAKNAGFQQGDIIVEFDGRKDLLRDADLLVYGVTKKKAGDKVSVAVLRDGKPRTLTLPMQQ